MAPTSKIVLIRHGQAAHNVADDFDIHDPLLTERGEMECQALIRDSFMAEYKDVNKVNCLMVSPLKRTLQTARGGFGKTLMANPEVDTIVHAALQETTARPCDTGSDLSELATLFPEFDFSSVDPNFAVKTHGFYHPDNLCDRATFVRKWFYESKYEHIVVVTHSGFLKRLTPQYFQITSGPKKDMYRNCEYREFTFANPNGPEVEVSNNSTCESKPKKGDSQSGIGTPYKLVETEWSRDHRDMKHAIAMLTTDAIEADVAARDKALEEMDVAVVGIGAKSEVPGDDGHEHPIANVIVNGDDESGDGLAVVGCAPGPQKASAERLSHLKVSKLTSNLMPDMSDDAGLISGDISVAHSETTLADVEGRSLVAASGPPSDERSTGTTAFERSPAFRGDTAVSSAVSNRKLTSTVDTAFKHITSSKEGTTSEKVNPSEEDTAHGDDNTTLQST